jgi:hypothetical protein
MCNFEVGNTYKALEAGNLIKVQLLHIENPPSVRSSLYTVLDLNKNRTFRTTHLFHPPSFTEIYILSNKDCIYATKSKDTAHGEFLGTIKINDVTKEISVEKE